MKRVGVALTRLRNGRQEEYGIYQSPSVAYGYPVEQSLYVQYEGYRKGDWRVGLPLAGPQAAHLEPYLPFYEADYETVSFFEGR